MLNRALIISLIVVNTSGRFLPDKYYFLCEAFALLFAGIFFYHNTKDASRIVAEWALILICGNLLDELIFDPCVFGYNEIIITLLSTLRAFYQWGKLKRK